MGGKQFLQCPEKDKNCAFAAESVLQCGDFIAEFMNESCQEHYKRNVRSEDPLDGLKIGEDLHAPYETNRPCQRTTGIYMSGYGLYYKGELTDKANEFVKQLEAVRRELPNSACARLDVKPMNHQAMVDFVTKATGITDPGITEKDIADPSLRAVLIQVMNIVQDWPKDIKTKDADFKFNGAWAGGFKFDLKGGENVQRYQAGELNVFKVPVGNANYSCPCGNPDGQEMPYSSYNCDVCGKSGSGERFTCRGCRWDMCTNCTKRSVESVGKGDKLYAVFAHDGGKERCP